MDKSPLDEARDLSSEILADMELGRVANHQVLLKCRRLARLTGDEIWKKWLDLELHGYNVNHPRVQYDELLAYFRLFGRELDQEKHTGLVHPLSTLEGEVETAKLELASCRVPSSIQASSSQSIIPDSASGAIQHVLFRLQELRTTITQRQVIIGRVLGLAHFLTLKWYSELHYGDIAQAIFERRRVEVDGRLKDLCPTALEQFVSAYQRLQSKTEEDWSQALLSCRRILKSFADSVFPPREERYLGSDGREHDISEDMYINRLIAFIDQNAPSATFGAVTRAQVEYLGDLLGTLHEATHKGVHARVTRREADSTVLLTYLLLSDLVDLVPISKNKLPESEERQLSQ